MIARPQLELFARPRGRLDHGVETCPEVNMLLADDAPVAMGVSGGKDSCALALATSEYLDIIGHRGPRILIHADLGRVEWSDSLRTCRRLADRLGLELVVVRRPSGDMMDRWLSRWAANVDRYRDLACVKLISPWSSALWRFCTSELKVAPICRELVRRFPGRGIVSAVGIRREESPGRSLTPIWKQNPGLRSTSKRTHGGNWHGIALWTADDVFAYLAAQGFPLHEGYTDYDMTRISCAWCVLQSLPDMMNAARHPEHGPLYREYVDLEISSTCSFQAKVWLGDVAPHLLTADQLDALADAKRCAVARQQAEARIPAHLLYTKGWPTCIPTRDEAELLCEVRLLVSAAVGLQGVRFLEPDALIGRYEELMAAKTTAGVAVATDGAGP